MEGRRYVRLTCKKGLLTEGVKMEPGRDRSGGGGGGTESLRSEPSGGNR